LGFLVSKIELVPFEPTQSAAEVEANKSKIYGRYQDEQDNLQLIEVRQTPLYLPPEPMGGTAQLFG